MRKQQKWLLLGAAVVIAGVVLYGLTAGGVSAEVLTVSKGEMEQYLEDTAQVMSRAEQTVYLEGTGKVTEIRVDVGDAVKQGDLLASIDKTDLALQLKDAEAGIKAAKAQLNGADMSNYTNKIAMAKVAVDQTKITYDAAQRSYENTKKLYEAEAVSQDEFKKAQAAYQTAAAALNGANLQLADAKQGTPAYLKRGYQAQLEQAIIQRDTILRSMQKQEVRAPIDGIVLEKLIEQNMLAAPGNTAFVLGRVDNLELVTDILADDINKVSIGDAVEISGKPLGDTIVKGKVSKIAPAAHTVTSSLGVNQQRVAVTITIAGKSTLLKPGCDLDVKIITTVKKDVIKVPDSAVFEYQGKDQVFVVKNGKARLQSVKKGIENGSFVEIQMGLHAGDVILVKPDNNIKEGIRIKALTEKQ